MLFEVRFVTKQVIFMNLLLSLVDVAVFLHSVSINSFVVLQKL